jgi:hypothetical protein
MLWGVETRDEEGMSGDEDTENKNQDAKEL